MSVSDPRKAAPRTLQIGFSLVELMVALALTGLLMAGMAKIFAASANQFATSSEVFGIQRSARFALLQLQETLAQAGYLMPPRKVTEVIGSGQPPLKIETLQLSGASQIKYNDGTADIVLPNPDELQMVMDIPLPIQGYLTTTVDPDAGGFVNNELTVTIAQGGSELKVGDVAFIQDSAWEMFKIQAITAAAPTYTLTLADNSTLLNAYGNDTSASLISPFIQNRHLGKDAGTLTGASVTFIRPLQVVSYTIQSMNLDPSSNTASVPCLVQRTKGLTDATFSAANTQIVVEGVTSFQVDWSLDSGKTWIRKANSLTTSNWAAIQTATNTVLTASTSPLTKLLVGGMNSTADPFWFNYIPVLIKVDVETRSRLKRTEYSNTANTADYRTRRETILISPRNFALAQPTI